MRNFPMGLLPSGKVSCTSEMQEKKIFLAISLGLHYLCARFLNIYHNTLNIILV